MFRVDSREPVKSYADDRAILFQEINSPRAKESTPRIKHSWKLTYEPQTILQARFGQR